MFDPNTNIEHYKKDPFDENGMSDNSIHGIYEDKDGLLWLVLIKRCQYNK